MARKTEYSPADYVVMALSPALIMMLVGSLVFFLLEILYAGSYSERLQWILFFFVFGAVLVSRISLSPDIASRANLYGAILGFLVWLGLILYVEYPADSPLGSAAWLVNLGLICLIWWCAHRLTWDCTYMDDKVGASGTGVLQAAGLEEGRQSEDEEKPAPAPVEGETWLDRYEAYRAKQKDKRIPGVWVVYFSLAALPLFGLGQALIPAEDGARRQYSFWLMLVYVGSGLGLLLTTAFLGLRLYLRKRKLEMPLAMTGAWLTVGGLMIAGLLFVGALLPRPSAEYRFLDLDPIGSKKRESSRYAMKGGQSGQDKGAERGEPGKDESPPRDKDGERQGKDGSPSNQRDKDGKGGNQKDQKDGASGKEKQKDSTGNQRRDQSESGKDQDRQNRDAQKDRQPRDGSPRKDDQQKDGARGEQESREASSPPPPTSGSWWQGIVKFLRWVVLIALGCVVLFVVLRSLLQFFANFSNTARGLLDALRRLWESLLALFRWGSDESASKEEADIEQPEREVGRSFASFTNPFDSGEEKRFSEQQLVRYTFAALQAWARDQEFGRQPEETPLEFARRVAEERPPLEEDVQRLANLYSRAVYGKGAMPTDTRERMRQFWQTLERTIEQPMSA